MGRASLQLYRAKRHFQRTPEPAGRKAKKTARAALRFVIQRHEARRLHYDFRLEVGGVLKSWAVPKGLSNDPRDKRLAIATEDHPLEYGKFEGTIPIGEYGAGRVRIWDSGTYRNLTRRRSSEIPLAQALENGHAVVWLAGRIVKGAYALTRIRTEPKPQWLIVKVRDEHAQSGRQPEAARQAEAVAPKPKRSAARASAGGTLSRAAGKQARVGPGTADGVMPPSGRSSARKWQSLTPMLATLTDRPFSDPKWIFEPKLDGERCLAFRAGDEVLLLTRNRKRLNDTYPEIVDALRRQKAREFVVDGEVVALQNGVPSFARLQQRMGLSDPRVALGRGVEVLYYLFDVLFLAGQDTRRLTLLRRKELLRRSFTFRDPLRWSAHVEAEGEALFHKMCHSGWEGVIAKRADSTYVHHRSTDWLKFKCLNEQEFVIGGFTEPQGARLAFGALLVGYYEGEALKYAGKVGTGYSSATLRQMGPILAGLERKTSPFAANGLPRGRVHWVEPRLVAQVAFGEWTRDGKLRHPRFLGLRRDKDAAEVVRERPA